MKVFGEYDVIVVGGGASGTAAAIAAARQGARTILIENLGAVGGMMNVFGPPGWAFSHLWNVNGEQIIGGFVQETHDILEKEGHALPMPRKEDYTKSAFALVDPDHYGLLMFRMLRENNVKLLLHSLCVDVLKEENTVKGVIVENTNGRMAVLGKVIIEATGEGDVAVMAGAEYSKADRTKEELDPPSITFHMDGVEWDKVTEYFKTHLDQFKPQLAMMTWPERALAKQRDLESRLMQSESILDLVREGVIGQVDYPELSLQAYKNGDLHAFGDLGHFFTPRAFSHFQAIFQHTAQVPDCDTNNVEEISDGDAEARRQIEIAIKAINKYLPGFEKAYLTRVTVAMRTREGRHLIGDYQMTVEDVRTSAKKEDVIAKCIMPVHVGGPFHSASAPGTAMSTISSFINPADGGSYDIPYRSMVPKGIEGMLITGKCISTTEDFKRDLLPDNIVWGQAAGIAAALCARDGKTPRELEKNVEELQSILLSQGAILYGTT